MKSCSLNEINWAEYDALKKAIKSCTACASHLPLGANPVLHFHPNAKLLLVGQAPGTAVHRTGVPWNDPSGRLLRQWLDMTDAEFYNEQQVAIVPMGFCYPGKGANGDLPPRLECAALWRERVHRLLPNVEMTLLIGRYAIDYYLPAYKQKPLQSILLDSETIFSQNKVPLVHPSPRNRRWLSQNDWFERDYLPKVRQKLQLLLH